MPEATVQMWTGFLICQNYTLGQKINGENEKGASLRQSNSNTEQPAVLSTKLLDSGLYSGGVQTA